MARINVGPNHTIAGIIHTQIERDDTQSDPEKAFFAAVHAPGVSFDLPLRRYGKKPAEGRVDDSKMKSQFNEYYQAQVDQAYRTLGTIGEDAARQLRSVLMNR